MQGTPATTLATTFTGKRTSTAGRMQGCNACRRRACQEGITYALPAGTEAAFNLTKARGRNE